MIIPFLKLVLLFGDAPVITAEPAVPPAAETRSSPCQRQKYEEASYTVCTFDQNDPGLRLFLKDETGTPFGEFDHLAETLSSDGQELIFAMNAGMYHEDRSPVGLYIEDGKQLAPLQTGEGYGNFHLLPNGVFFMEKGEAWVLSTGAYQIINRFPEHATQSGPMLVIDDKIHPKFNPDSTSFKRRNGVGVDAETGQLYFVLSDGWVTFHAFASFFRDELDCENALYLDGTISRLYAPSAGRNDVGTAMGPILGIVRPSSLSLTGKSD